MEAALRALADDSRRTMLETLAGGPATAGELAALLPIARPGVSRHRLDALHTEIARGKRDRRSTR